MRMGSKDRVPTLFGGQGTPYNKHNFNSNQKKYIFFLLIAFYFLL